MFLSKRTYTKEIMDDFSIRDERIDQALRELKIINKFLGGAAVTSEGINILRRQDAPLKILDIGSGGADVFKNSEQLEIYSVDRNIRAARYLKKTNSKINVICADAFSLPIKEGTMDIAHAALFLHHFKDEEIYRLLSKCKSIAKQGIIINDLRRSLFAFIAIKILTRLFSKSKMVKNDGPLSVLKAFSRNDMQKILQKLSVKYLLKKKWAFRWLALIPL